ncbi:hypothetical protein MAPG_08884 [Magnaporthiopsis poae ATCC 64411]|uniref:Uncharacterized protein n=1 Tax=Magnaporthiopsis poae (strain ATCC 64411 / 73-15) TaxID=644358 RepID=A0A0C4E8H7_MAGP6|nr:hypothetical protein MAPG_08884 [Magnaporthiopsis poae ATCC 64411]
MMNCSCPSPSPTGQRHPQHPIIQPTSFKQQQSLPHPKPTSKMHFTTVVATLALALAPAALAAPSEGQTVEARDQHLMNAWDLTNFRGSKLEAKANPGQCKDFSGAFDNKVSSAKALHGWKCTIWADKKCKGAKATFGTSGIANLPSAVNNKGSSWKCVKA